MSIAIGGVEPAIVPLANMAFPRILRWAIVKVSRTETRIVPGVALFKPPNFENIGSAIANRDRAGRILNFRHGTARIYPVIDEWAIGIIHPLSLSPASAPPCALHR